MRPIDADALKNAFEEDGHLSGYIEEFIDDMPTLDIVPAVHGKWDEHSCMWYCSVCNKWIDVLQGTADMNYCPNCGARMDKEE